MNGFHLICVSGNIENAAVSLLYHPSPKCQLKCQAKKAERGGDSLKSNVFVRVKLIPQKNKFSFLRNGTTVQVSAAAL